MPYYLWYELNHAALSPFRASADMMRLYYKNPLNPLSRTQFGKSIAAGCELFERVTRRYGKPEFGITDTEVSGRRVPVRETTVLAKPFCNLIHFEKSGSTPAQPKLLIVAPMSGHYATLLRGTVVDMLPKHDVYITDWIDARMVPLAEGSFDLDDYIDYIIAMLRDLGGDTHVIAVCQPSVPVLAAVALMSTHNDPCVPLSMTLMGGPIDTRENPTAVNQLAEERGTEWFERNVITKVPFPHPGVMRSVYPGFLQLSGFMSMNLDRHMTAHRDLFRHLVDGDGDSAEKHREFYDEYMAVMDLTAEFYLQTVQKVFVEHALPKKTFDHRGTIVDCGDITRTALMTVEGERDDISGLGQTRAAHKLCTALPADMKVHYEQPRVGHYGVFNGSRFRADIAPRIADFILTHDPDVRRARDTRKKPATAAAAVAAGTAEPVVAAPPRRRPKASRAAPARPAPRQPTRTGKPAAAKTANAKPAAAKTANAKTANAKTAKRANGKTANGIYLDKPDGTPDDLTRISGIGEKLAARLNELGIFHFRQIAALSARQVSEIDDRLAFKGRIARDGWVRQAKSLVGG